MGSLPLFEHLCHGGMSAVHCQFSWSLHERGSRPADKRYDMWLRKPITIYQVEIVVDHQHQLVVVKGSIVLGPSWSAGLRLLPSCRSPSVRLLCRLCCRGEERVCKDGP